MKEEQKRYIQEMLDEVAKRRDICIAIYWLPDTSVSISIYPYSEEE